MVDESLEMNEQRGGRNGSFEDELEVLGGVYWRVDTFEGITVEGSVSTGGGEDTRESSVYPGRRLTVFMGVERWYSGNSLPTLRRGTGGPLRSCFESGRFMVLYSWLLM